MDKYVEIVQAVLLSLLFGRERLYRSLEYPAKPHLASNAAPVSFMSKFLLNSVLLC